MLAELVTIQYKSRNKVIISIVKVKSTQTKNREKLVEG